MVKTLRAKCSRLAQMSGQELRERIGQEAAKRLDAAFYRLGLPPRHAQHIAPCATGQTPNFFFSPHKITERINLLRLHLPQDVQTILADASDICRHRFRLLGYNGLDYGNEIDWHFDAVGKKRAPIKPWHKIRFLDFAEAGDHKVIWELNRHQHLVTLAKACRLTGEQRYCQELVQQWYSWQKANPYPLGVNWASSLEAAFRSLSWIWVDQLLLGCSSLPSGFRSDLIASLAFHGRFIERYLSTYFSPNTHLLGEATALFFIGTMYPEISAAERWQTTGLRILLEESKCQVRFDGVYFEQALYYHVYALDLFLHTRLLAQRNAIPVSEQFDETVGRMLDVVQSLSQCGPPESFGDDDGGRLFNSRRNQMEFLTDPLALGTLLYGRNDLFSARLTEESIWLFGNQAETLSTRYDAKSAVQPRSFPAGGLYIMTDCSPRPQQMMIDAGPQGIGHSGHGHADALSLRFTMNGDRWLIDPGTGSYISANGEERDWFRGTSAHNTLCVDGTDQAVATSPFSWNSIPQVSVDGWMTGKTFNFFSGRHTGYTRLTDPVIHRRMIFHLHNEFWLIRDIADGKSQHRLEVFWHLTSEMSVARESNTCLITRSNGNDHVQPQLAMQVPANSAWKILAQDGWISPAYGRKEKALVICAQADAVLPAELATLLIAGTNSSFDVGSFTQVEPASASPVHAYRYVTQGMDHLIFFADTDKYWRSGVWSSDASLLYCGLEHGRLQRLVMIAGSRVQWNEREIMTSPGKTAYFEWLKQPGGNELAISEDSLEFSKTEH